MEFIDYFKQQEAEFIRILGEKDWLEQKVYFVEEIDDLVQGYLQQCAAETAFQEALRETMLRQE